MRQDDLQLLGGIPVYLESMEETPYPICPTPRFPDRPMRACTLCGKEIILIDPGQGDYFQVQIFVNGLGHHHDAENLQ